MTAERIELMTFSRQDSFKSCRRKHWWSYEQGIRPINSARALRMGSAWHKALELLAAGKYQAAIDFIRSSYAELPNGYDELGWVYECETLTTLLACYAWRWENAPFKYVAKEQAFELPLVNPETGRASTNWRWAGKIDGIVQLDDGRLAVVEHKLLGEDMGPDAVLWRRLRVDHQISLYVAAARQLGYDVSTVLYDAARKPGIAPTAVPLTDEAGVKIVHDRNGNRVRNANGKTWRQTASTEDGYVLQTRAMRPEEWTAKLSNDVAVRHEHYFQRVEIARLDDEIEEAIAELWDIQKTMRDAQIHDRHFRTVNKQTCQFCQLFDPCTSKFDPTTGAVPVGFERVADVHPELERSQDAADSPVDSTSAAASTGGTTETTTAQAGAATAAAS